MYNYPVFIPKLSIFANVSLAVMLRYRSSVGQTSESVCPRLVVALRRDAPLRPLRLSPVQAARRCGRIATAERQRDQSVGKGGGGGDGDEGRGEGRGG